MAVLIVTKGKGGTSRPTEMTSVPQPQEVSLGALRQVAREAGVNDVFLADTLSAFATHERVAARFASAASRQSSGQELQQLHDVCARMHRDHLAVLEELMQAIGIDPLYVSPAGRMTAYVNEKLTQAPLLAGSVEETTMELTLCGLQVAMLEEDRVNVQILAEIAANAQPSELKNALQSAAERLGTMIADPLQKARNTYTALYVRGALAGTK